MPHLVGKKEGRERHFASPLLFPSLRVRMYQQQPSPLIAARASLTRKGIRASAATLSSHHQQSNLVAAKPTIKTIERYPQVIASTASARENTPEALANSIEQSSGKKLSILANGAAEMAGNLYSWPRVFEQLFYIYREVCANCRRS